VHRKSAQPLLLRSVLLQTPLLLPLQLLPVARTLALLRSTGSNSRVYVPRRSLAPRKLVSTLNERLLKHVLLMPDGALYVGGA